LFFYFQAVATFGFVVFISAVLPNNMNPKLAAKWGSLIYFGSTFADFSV